MQKNRINQFKNSLKESEIIDINGYKYFINSLTDGTCQIEPPILCSASEEIIQKIYKDILDGNCNKFITPEAMGIPVTTLVSYITGIPYVIVRKRKYGLKGELPVEQVTGYSKNTLYLNGVNQQDNVIIIDDILSTGGTLKALLKTINLTGAKVISVIVLVFKGDDEVIKNIEQEFNIPVKYLYKVKIENNKVILC
jgi:adenine phosphoribosyltransferase